MKSELSSPKLRALPAQVISASDVVCIKRGGVEVRVGGEHALEIVQRLLLASAGAGATSAEIEARFCAAELPMVKALLTRLLARGLVVSEYDDIQSDANQRDPAEVFFWEFGTSVRKVAERMASQRIVVAGVNLITRRLVEGLGAYGVEGVEVFDVPDLRNPALFDANGYATLGGESSGKTLIHSPQALANLDPEELDCLVATSDNGGIAKLARWNEFCQLHNRLFLPVVLEDCLGFVGPLVVPGESACLECFRARRLTHASDAAVRRAVEEASATSLGVTGMVAPMASILGDVACMELLKFLGMHGVGQVGVVVEVNLMVPTMTTRPVLRLPRCSVCSPVAERPLSFAKLIEPR